MSEQNWRTEVTSVDYFGNQKKQLAVADRRPVIRKASDLVGPGIAATAVRLSDFNDLLATYDGFYSSAAGAVNAPEALEEYVGQITSDSTTGGVQTFTALTTETKYQRVFRRNPGDAATIYWGSWEVIAAPAGGGGGGAGGIASVQEGFQITVDTADPLNPVVATIGLVESVEPGLNITVDNSDPYHPVVSADVDLSGVADTFINTDAFVATGSGDQTFDLTYIPKDGSLHVRWEPLNIPISRCSLVDNHLTISDPDGRFRSGHPITAAYAVTRGATPLVVPTGGALVPFGASGWKWMQVPRTDAGDYSSPTFDDSGWDTASAAFGETHPAHSGHYGTWGDYTTVWQVFTKMWARKHLTTATPGVDIVITPGWDRYIRVYWNGVDLWGSLDSTVSGAGSPRIISGALVTGDDHLAISITDNGWTGAGTGDCFFDVELTQ
jgi:hypothetical protein